MPDSRVRRPARTGPFLIRALQSELTQAGRRVMAEALDMADVWTRILENLADRLTGPMSFRFFLQPVVASVFAIVAGLQDPSPNCRMRPAAQGISEAAHGKTRRKRRSRVQTAQDPVVGELLRRGFEAQLAGCNEHELLVQAGDSPPMPVHVKTVHSTPWYVRRASFVGSLADQVTVYVLLGLQRSTKAARFFVAMNSDLAAQFRQPPTWRIFGFIDAKSERACHETEGRINH